MVVVRREYGYKSPPDAGVTPGWAGASGVSYAESGASVIMSTISNIIHFRLACYTIT
jgi:hypothetical protein